MRETETMVIRNIYFFEWCMIFFSPSFHSMIIECILVYFTTVLPSPKAKKKKKNNFNELFTEKPMFGLFVLYIYLCLLFFFSFHFLCYVFTFLLFFFAFACYLRLYFISFFNWSFSMRFSVHSPPSEQYFCVNRVAAVPNTKNKIE